MDPYLDPNLQLDGSIFIFLAAHSKCGWIKTIISEETTRTQGHDSRVTRIYNKSKFPIIFILQLIESLNSKC